METIVRAPKGTDRQEVEVDKIQVPDLWHVAMYLKDNDMKTWGEMVQDCWHLTHDLIQNIKADRDGIEL